MNFFDFSLNDLLDKAIEVYGEVEVYDALKRRASELAENLEGYRESKQYDRLSDVLNECYIIALSTRTNRQASSHFSANSPVATAEIPQKKQNGHLEHHPDSLTDVNQR